MQSDTITTQSHRSESLYDDSNQRKSDNGNDSIISNGFLHELTHSVGHDLRSPMFVIRSYSQLLKKNQDKDRLDRGLNMIGEATLNMEKIIDGLVQLVDIYTLPTPNYEKLDFKTVFDAVQVQLYNELEQFSPKLVTNFSAIASVLTLLFQTDFYMG